MTAARKKPEELRSHRWFGVRRPALVRPPLAHRADGLRRATTTRASRSSRSSTPGATSTPATRTSAQRAEEVKRGVWQAGGFPVEMPAHDAVASRSRSRRTMLYRNLLAMETEELLRSYPVDGCVLMGGCDKTTPALLMGAHQHEPARDLRAGRADAARRLARPARSAAAATSGSTGPSCAPATSPRSDWREIEDGIARSPGHCMTMGTASTMTAAAEALGLTLPGRRVDPRRRLAPRADGRADRARASSTWSGRTCKPRDILDARGVRQRGHRRCWRSAARPTPSST